jgi:PAS domain S-box-containing protein
MDFRILIVEDSQELAPRIVSRIERIEGVSVAGVVRGEREACEAIDRLAPDAVLLDLRLLNGSGFGVLSHVRSSGVTPAMIVLSNHTDPVTHRLALQTGAHWVFDKSTDFPAMLDCVTELARTRRRHHPEAGSPPVEPASAPMPSASLEGDLLEFAGQIARFGGWYIDLEAEEVHWSGEVFAIHELPERRRITVGEALSFYHPDDRPRIEEFYRACAEEGVPWNAELRMITAKGRQIWVHTLGRPVSDAEGRIVRVQGAFQDVTRRRRAEERAGRLERTLAENLERMSDAFFTIDREWRFTWVNAAATRVFQRSEEELLGRECWEVFPGTRELELGRESERAMEMEVAHEFVAFLPARKLWVEARTFPIEEGMAVYFRDVTEERERLHRLSEQAVLIDEARDGIVAWGEDWRVSLWNQGAERAFGWTAEQAVGGDLIELLGLDEAAVATAVAVVEQEGEWAGELRARDRAGEEALLEARWSRVEAADNSVRMLGIHTDITGRRKLEQRTLRAQRLESIGTLAGGIAHDLNNILTPILMALEPLADDLSNEDRECLETIETCVLRGSALVKRLLGFARGTAVDRAELRPEVVVEEVVELVRSTFPSNIRIHTDLPSELWSIPADSTQVHQVLMNLCVNARDAMPEGGALTISASNAEFSHDPHPGGPREGTPGRFVALTVTDTGSGIDDATITRIFDPFFTTKLSGAGTGLGLSTVDAIARGHGGFVRVYSEPGEGARFMVYFPVTAPISPEAEVARSAPERSRPEAGRDRLVMVVDDEALIRSVMRRILEHGGYRVLEAADGEEALAAFDEADGEVCAVVTDLMMPRLDGVALARSLLKRSPGLPIVVATGFAESHRRREIDRLGVREVLTKPYPGQELLWAIDRSTAA